MHLSIPAFHLVRLVVFDDSVERRTDFVTLNSFASQGVKLLVIVSETSDNLRCLRSARRSLSRPLARASPHSLPSLRLHAQTRAVANVGAPRPLDAMLSNFPNEY